MWFPHIAIDFVFVLDMVILYLPAIRFSWYAIICNSSSDVAIKIWSYAYSMVFSIFLLFSGIPLFITNLNSCITLLMYILNNTGERPHPCLTPLTSQFRVQITYSSRFGRPLKKLLDEAKQVHQGPSRDGRWR